MINGNDILLQLQVASLSAPRITYFRCTDCNHGFYGEQLLSDPPCPTCHTGVLRTVDEWDLERDPFFPFHTERGKA